MTEKEIFDKIWKHFVIDKGNPAVHKFKDFAYRFSYISEDKKCKSPTGLFIDEAKYNPQLELMQPLQLYQTGILTLNIENIDSRIFELMWVCDQAHDFAHIDSVDNDKLSYTEAIKRRLEEIAKKFNIQL